MGFRPQHRPLGGFRDTRGTLSNVDMANMDRVPNGPDTESPPTNMSDTLRFSAEDSLHSEPMPGIARSPGNPRQGALAPSRRETFEAVT